MAQKTVIILYNGVEINLEINLEQINKYELLMEKLYSTITDYNPSNSYNLMAINSTEPYTLVDEGNYLKIMNEEINGENLKLFLNKISLDSNENTDNTQNINNPPSSSNNIAQKVVIDDDGDDDFEIEKEEENKENENINIINEEKDKENNIQIEENININKLESKDSEKTINNDDNIEDDKENDNNLINETNIMIEKIQKLMGQKDLEIYKHSKTVMDQNIKNISNNDKININNNSKNNNNPMNFTYKKNSDSDNFNIILDNEDDKIKNDINDDNNNISNNKQLTTNLINIDTFKSIKCSICKNNLLGIKYICCVCENCILCSDCELEHYHPCIKFKTPFLSNIEDIYKFLTRFYSFKVPSNNFFMKFFRKEYEITLIPLTDKKICLRPGKNVLLPIKISNFSTEAIRSSQIDIIPKDNKLVQIYKENKNFTIGPYLPYTLKMKCISGDKIGNEKIIFYGFSEYLNFKNPENLKFSLEFEINEDEEEEKMNENLGNNENVILYNKNHKKIALNILKSIGDSNRSVNHINKVFNILIRNNWDEEKSINIIKSLDS